MRSKVQSITDSKARHLVRSRARQIVQSMVVMLAVMMAAACTPLQQKAGYSSSSPSADQVVSTEIAEFLSHSASNSSAAFSQTPWGDNATLFAKASYFSASGAECRQLIVESASRTTGLACTLNNQAWYKARALTAGAVQ